MTPALLLFVTYSGLWGGSERILLDAATSAGGPAVLLCPEGALAERARAAGLPVLLARTRPLELRGGARTRPARRRADLAGHAAEMRRVVRALRPRAVVGWGMRSAIAAAGALRTLPEPPPLLFEHVDLLPGPAASRPPCARRRGPRRPHVVLSRAIAATSTPRARLRDRIGVAEPGIDVDRFAPAPLPAGPPTALLLGAIVGWKRPDLALEAVALAVASARPAPRRRRPRGGGGAARRCWRRCVAGRGEPDLAGRVELPRRAGRPRRRAGRRHLPAALRRRRAVRAGPRRGDGQRSAGRRAGRRRAAGDRRRGAAGACTPRATRESAAAALSRCWATRTTPGAPASTPAAAPSSASGCPQARRRWARGRRPRARRRRRATRARGRA